MGGRQGLENFLYVINQMLKFSLSIHSCAVHSIWIQDFPRSHSPFFTICLLLSRFHQKILPLEISGSQKGGFKKVGLCERERWSCLPVWGLTEYIWEQHNPKMGNRRNFIYASFFLGAFDGISQLSIRT